MKNATTFALASEIATAAGAAAHAVKTGPNAVHDLLVSGPSVNVLRAVAALGLSRGGRRKIPADKLHGARVRYDLSDIDGRLVGTSLLTMDGGSATVFGVGENAPKCFSA